MSTHPSSESKKGHVCPPSDATHPSDRWESLFVYSFICKFTNLRAKVEGLETPMDFEAALLSQEPNTILTQLLARFILNLRPQTRNLSIDQISTTVATVLADYLKTPERTIYWDDDLRINKDPFEGLEGGFWTTNWDFKLKILRQLVELQLVHTPEIKATIDRAWGVSQNKHKKKDAASAPPDPTDAQSQAQLQLVPLGQDMQKKRYWVADDSPRVYVSTNPWRVSATFQTISTTREEYMALIEDVKAMRPGELRKGAKRTKQEQAHLNLYEALESRVEAIDAELLRVEKARKRLEQRQAALARAAQAEVRETRTRRQARKPDYVYNNTLDDEEDEGDEYTYQEAEYDDEADDDFLNFRDDSEGPSSRRASSSAGRRRSTRTAVVNANGKRQAQDDGSQWRGERRSSRLGAPPETQFDVEPRTKRARTEDSTMSTGSADAVSSTSHGASNNIKLKNSGAAALKPTEVAMEQIAGKKRSKFWVYAVEPIPGVDADEPIRDTDTEPPPKSDAMNGDAPSDGAPGTNGQDSDMEVDSPPPRPGHRNGRKLDRGLDGSTSPSNSSGNVLSSPANRVFRFRGCLYAKNEVTRSSSRTYASHSTTHTIPASVEDKALCTIFDRPKSSFGSSSFSTTGLFGHRRLTHPSALVDLTDATLLRAQLLTDRILRARESRQELLLVVKNLDRLSDLLCGVIDLAELVQNAHPERQWIEAAGFAHEKLCNFMNVLNTHTGLYAVLKAVLNDPSIVKTLSPEAHATALIFWRDFENSAIDLPSEKREKFVSLSSDILTLGRKFLQGVSAPGSPAAIKPSELAGLKDQGMGVRLQLQARFTQRDLLVYPGSLQAQMIMRSAPAEEPRRRVYIASNSSTPEQIDALERLLRARAELANLVGKPSFAHMALDDKMAKSPGNVAHFIDALLDHTRPAARSALRALSLRKQVHLNTPESFPIIQAWDRDFYCPPEPPAPPISLPPLTLGTVFMGLSRLLRHLYGISLRPVGVTSGEVWHSDVTKLEVVDEQKGVVGWVYADLFARRGKASGAAHYTVRCSRRTDHDDEPGDRVDTEMEPLIGVSREFEAVKRHTLPGQDGIFQLPLVVLVCEFARPSAANGPTVLQWHEVMTLFHEMGHAMHSMIGRTEYQNVAGTRCATDFVELPSILMEHFLNSPTVLSLFDAESTSFTRQSGNHHEDPCHSIDTYSQILLAALDQVYHSPGVVDPSFDSTAELALLHNTRGLIPHVPGTSFQTHFGHLVGYAATYYSYLFDRAIASRVWRNVFSADPLDRKTGEKYKREVLSYGGGKDPWKMVSTLLAAPELESGDAEAMREVGRWRIEDEVTLGDRH
ncbi:peptidase family M3-domain-containing protein [Favolaschia claudopus]|uniref:Mitochondrial intermediate peptidase n=1 Tax=Favolaschia claudopus TaxID=2862362 RepID=A0AAW0EJ08_9AGAR